MRFVNNGTTLSVHHWVYMNTIESPVKLMIGNCLNCIINALSSVNIEDELDFLNSLFVLERGFSASANMIKHLSTVQNNK